jgi:RimJ/RimL family protein N-acetyltransferase
MTEVGLRRSSSPKYLELWIVEDAGKRIGKIYTQKQGAKVFVSIFLNKPQQRKGFGLVAMRLFMQETRYRELYAKTRKSNRPMRKILQKLGWRQLDGGLQALYGWRKVV